MSDLPKEKIILFSSSKPQGFWGFGGKEELNTTEKAFGATDDINSKEAAPGFDFRTVNLEILSFEPLLFANWMLIMRAPSPHETRDFLHCNL